MSIQRYILQSMEFANISGLIICNILFKNISHRFKTRPENALDAGYYPYSQYSFFDPIFI